MTSTRRYLAIIALAILTANGCFWAPGLDAVREDFQGQMPGAKFEREFAITLGPISLALAKLATRFIPDAREAHPYVRELSRIQVAVYEVTDGRSRGGVTTPATLDGLTNAGWKLAVRVREDHESVWILYRGKREAVREFYAVVMGDDELVVIRARGRFERIVERAIESRGDLAANLVGKWH